MGFTIKPRCLSCNQEWPNALIGTSKHFVCICRRCSNIVNPVRNGFRHELKPCSECGEALIVDDAIDMLNTPIDHAGKLPSGVKCPRCGDGDIAFRTLDHFSLVFNVVAPEPNEFVHGKMIEGKLVIPGMFPFNVVIHLVGAPADIGDRWMELRTGTVVRNGEMIDSIEFAFVRYLDM